MNIDMNRRAFLGGFLKVILEGLKISMEADAPEWIEFGLGANARSPEQTPDGPATGVQAGRQNFWIIGHITLEANANDPEAPKQHAEMIEDWIAAGLKGADLNAGTTRIDTPYGGYALSVTGIEIQIDTIGPGPQPASQAEFGMRGVIHYTQIYDR